MRICTSVTMILALAACRSTAFSAGGSANATIHEPGKADVIATYFASDDETLSSSAGDGTSVYGACTQNGNVWTADIHASTNDKGTLRDVHVTFTESAATAAFSFTLVDGAVFTGSCSIASDAGQENHDFPIASNCSGLSLAGDPRTLDGGLTMTFHNCSGG